MTCSLIFYGTLMDLKLARKITGLLPKECQVGYIYGEIYEIVDYTEPNNIYKYPILTLNKKKLKIVAMLVKYELKNNEVASFCKKLKAYEGPLYRFVKTSFYDVNDCVLCGYAAVAKNKLDLQSNSNAKKIVNLSSPYTFLTKCVIK